MALTGLKHRCGTIKLNDDRWKQPDRRNFLFINVDSATNNLSGSCGLGIIIIIRDSVGEVFVQELFTGSFLSQLKLRKVRQLNGAFLQLWTKV